MKTILTALLLSVAAAQAVELIADTEFQRGLNVKDRSGHKHVIAWNTNAAPPVWNTAQHHSKSSFADQAFQKITTNGFSFQDAYEMLSIHPTDTDADFVCGVNADHEFGGKLREKGDPWPHLYLEQRISEPQGHLGTNAPSLADIEKINFSVNVKLLHDRKKNGPTYSRHVHAAQFLVFFTIQNLNHKSKGFGDYYWFGISLYDDRYPVTTLFAMQDKGSPKKKGTDKFIYNIGVKPFTDKAVANGEWVRVAGDLRPYIVAGLQECWRRGYLADTKTLADYRFGGLVLGWEVTGLNDVAMAVKGLKAEAVVKE
ncbi:MAG: hypothetical protein EPN23_07975 [Verrucomicrobia bacterium]|nr:MAG: hypothetical protein EPN23_07975 [Verrucomicrobiota bacterium]